MSQVDKFDAFGLIEEYHTTYDYLFQSAFDEMMEMDVENDWIQNKYHIENKYYVPVLGGSLREMIAHGIESMIHPDDVHIFRDFFDLSNIKERLEAGTPKDMLKMKLREKLIDGTYRWVQYTMITGIEHGVEAGKIVIFVYDIQNQEDRAQKRKTENINIKERDKLTGLRERRTFFNDARMSLVDRYGSWCIIAIDIDRFKIYNEWYGWEKGDYLLAKVGSVLQNFEKEKRSITGYFGYDDFCIIMPYVKDDIITLYDKISDTVTSYTDKIGFTPKFGVIVFAQDEDITLNLYDHAVQTIDNGVKYDSRKICYMDDSNHKQEEEMKLINSFKDAIKDGEIQFYLQPLVRASSERIVGAEALARWIKKDGTSVSPGYFIPILENNGFIADFDTHIWREVFVWLRSLIDKGIDPLPVSINISREDFRALDVAAYLYALSFRYNIPRNLIKIEITESAYAESFEDIKKFVTDLRSKGFQVSMDDFGSGYSSLSMLSYVDVDIFKLDMNFIKIDPENRTRGIRIIEAIVNMSKSIGVPLIVEGVENDEDLKFFMDLGVRYIQGYCFFRPMPKAEYEKLISDKEKVDRNGVIIKRTDQFRAKEIFENIDITDSMLNHILGAVAAYVYDGENINITRFNEQFYQNIGDKYMGERINAIQRFVIETDRPLLFETFRRAKEDVTNGGRCSVRFKKANGSICWFYMHLFFIREEADGQHFFGKIMDVTEQRTHRMELFQLLKDTADFTFRIETDIRLVHKIKRGQRYLDPNVETFSLEEFVEGYVKKFITDEDDKKTIVSLLDPAKIKDIYRDGVLKKTFETVIMKDNAHKKVVISVYYNRVLSDRKIEVYVFVNYEK